MSIAKYWEEQDPRIKAIQLDEKRDTVYASWKTALDICFEITDCEYLQIAPGDDFLFNHDYVEIALQKLSAGDLNGLVPNCKYEIGKWLWKKLGTRVSSKTGITST